MEDNLLPEVKELLENVFAVKYENLDHFVEDNKDAFIAALNEVTTELQHENISALLNAAADENHGLIVDQNGNQIPEPLPIDNNTKPRLEVPSYLLNT